MRDIDTYSKDYMNEPGEYYQAKYRKRKIIEVLSKYSHKHILEIGCGLDSLLNYMDDFESMTIIEPGTFFFNKALDSSKENNKVRCVNDFFENWVDHSDVEPGVFDYIVLSSLLHELEEPEELLNKLRKICGSDTVVHINVPNAKSLHRLLAVEMGIISDVYQLSEQQIKMQRHHVFDLNLLNNLVKENGFHVIESGSYYPKFFSGSQMDQIISMGIVNDFVFDGLYGLSKYLEDYGSEIYVNVKIGKSAEK